MPSEGYASLSVPPETNKALERIRDSLLRDGASKLPPDVRAHVKNLTRASVVRAGLAALEKALQQGA